MFIRQRLFCALLIAVLWAVLPNTHGLVRANEPGVGEPAATVLSDKIGSFKADGRATVVEVAGDDPALAVDFERVFSAERSYVGPNGQRITAAVFSAPSQSSVYAILTARRNALSQVGMTAASTDLGTAGYVFPGRILFVQSKFFVVVKAGKRADDKLLNSFASAFAANLELGEDEIPVLVKHLPDWESAQERVTYFVNPNDLRVFIPSPIFDVLNFEGGAEAASANYGSAQLVVVEFTTPQHATEADLLVLAQLEKLRGKEQVLPTAYRRVGNYGVFVFNAADEQAAKQLIDQIKYEQVTKWLGDNPYPLLEAQRRYTAQTLGVLVSVVKASGIAIITCLTVGGILGGLLFIRRRAQQRSVEAYSDAGGMLRLNLDEMTPQTDPARLLGRGH
jgi:hypothetical protein